MCMLCAVQKYMMHISLYIPNKSCGSYMCAVQQYIRFIRCRKVFGVESQSWREVVGQFPQMRSCPQISFPEIVLKFHADLIVLQLSYNVVSYNNCPTTYAGVSGV